MKKEHHWHQHQINAKVRNCGLMGLQFYALLLSVDTFYRGSLWRWHVFASPVISFARQFLLCICLITAKKMKDNKCHRISRCWGTKNVGSSPPPYSPYRLELRDTHRRDLKLIPIYRVFHIKSNILKRCILVFDNARKLKTFNR